MTVYFLLPPGQLPPRVPSLALGASPPLQPRRPSPPPRVARASSLGLANPGMFGVPEAGAGRTLQPTSQKCRCLGLKEGPRPSSGTQDLGGWGRRQVYVQKLGSQGLLDEGMQEMAP